MDSMRDFQAERRQAKLTLLQEVGEVAYVAMQNYAAKCRNVEFALEQKQKKAAFAAMMLKHGKELRAALIRSKALSDFMAKTISEKGE